MGNIYIYIFFSTFQTHSVFITTIQGRSSCQQLHLTDGKTEGQRAEETYPTCTSQRVTGLGFELGLYLCMVQALGGVACPGEVLSGCHLAHGELFPCFHTDQTSFP